ncbi:MAG: hypothetical protein LBG20_03885 [Holosporaceae bacterium]|nr:hypothetical protein [Holosporaceae bacterium]
MRFCLEVWGVKLLYNENMEVCGRVCTAGAFYSSQITVSIGRWLGSSFKKRIYSLRSDFPLSIGAEHFHENQI